MRDVMAHIARGRRSSALVADICRALKSGLAWYAACLHRSQQRRALCHLSDRMLRDIGVDRLDAQKEARKPFWK
jgi:uncharacterized protein YjiS (DUF1127 family)